MNGKEKMKRLAILQAIVFSLREKGIPVRTPEILKGFDERRKALKGTCSVSAENFPITEKEFDRNIDVIPQKYNGYLFIKKVVK